ncbi:hypothetical protein ISS07_00520 [Candidatus Woesearchaeota archaeon]|nr:hypothetical protein [Candidatus Woesearchaeota archaeon]
MESVMTLTMVLTAVCVVLLMLLIGIYSKNLRKIRSPFTLGLLIFASLFLLQNLVSFYFFFTMMDYYVADVAMHVFIQTLLQAIAFSILLVITWE